MKTSDLVSIFAFYGISLGKYNEFVYLYIGSKGNVDKLINVDDNEHSAR